MVAGSEAASVTDCVIVKVPPTGDADTVGGVVSVGGGATTLKVVADAVLDGLLVPTEFSVDAR